MAREVLPPLWPAPRFCPHCGKDIPLLPSPHTYTDTLIGTVVEPPPPDEDAE